MKPKQLIITTLCLCSLLTLSACGKTEKFSLKEPRPSPSVSASAQPTPTQIASASPTPPPTPTVQNNNNTEAVYIGNKTTKIFHLPACHTLPNKKNRVNLYSRETAISQNYKPCKNCKP